MMVGGNGSSLIMMGLVVAVNELKLANCHR